MSQNSHSRRRRSMDRAARAEARAKRRPVIEALEDRRLMAVNLNDPRLSYPAIGRYTADLPEYLSPAEYARRSQLRSGSGNGGGTQGAGEAGAGSQFFEQESNNTAVQANFLPLGTGPGQLQALSVNGILATSDEDFFSADLRAGDFVKVELVTPQRFIADVSLNQANGSELIGATTNQLLGLPSISPLSSTTASVGFASVIESNGRHTFRLANGIGAYSLRLSVFRSTFEAEAIGTRQILFLDFNGATFNGNIFGLPNSVRIPSMIDTVEQFGINRSEENLLIDRVVERFQQNFLGTLSNLGGNGSFGRDRVPGQFDIDIRNSRDHADPWGLPNVSRIIIGGGELDLGIAVRGIAQSVDIGNFVREETAVVLPEAFFNEDIDAVPRAASKSLIDVLAMAIGQTGSHEAGHYFGARHQENTNLNLQLMDSGGQPLETSRLGVGRDGIFGTADDVNITFGRDRYAFSPDTAEGLTGTINHAINLAFALSTGTRGGSITGLVYNDNNRNTRQDGGEGGLSPWQVYVDLNNNGVRDAGEPGATTDASGRYNIGIGAGTYNLRTIYPAGWIPSTSTELVKTVTVTLGAAAAANFGAVFPQVGATGFKWLDVNGDGIRDASEPGLAGVYVYLDLDGDARPDIGEPATLTKADGSYTLTPPQAGTFQIREVVDAGFVQTFPASGFHTAVYNGSTPLAGFDFGNRESADWGDAPAPYATTRAQNGASAGLLPGFRLGTNWDAEFDGANSTNADGDDLNAAVDDEDGITLLSPIIRGDSQNSLRINVTNTAGIAAYVNAWIDFNGNGVWGDAGEQITTNLVVNAGDNIINFTTPSNAVNRTAARFRLSSVTGIGPTGRSAAGEVEDYIFNISDGPRRNLQDDRFTVVRNSVSNQFDVLANDFISPSDPIAEILVSQPSQGGSVIVGAGNVLRYTPARGFFGQETFKYTVVYSSDKREEATVNVSVVLQFVDPVAVDDSFDIPSGSQSFPLNVLLNDIEGRNGALTITGVSRPDKGGTATIGSGGLSIRYTPSSPSFGGTERFTYTAVDGAGKTTTANVTVHTLGGDRLDDDVQFSFAFFSMANQPISRVVQGDQFQVFVYTYDLRPERGAGQSPPVTVQNPGVFAAYLDLLYSSKLVMPASPGSNTSLDFANVPQGRYTLGVSGTAQFPGIIQSLGAFVDGNNPPPFEGRPTLFQKLTFTANSAGLADFAGDPANQSPNTDVVLFNPPNSPVAVEKVRYLRSTIEVLPRGVELPFAVDDSPAPLSLNTTSFIDVLRNDIVGTAGPLRISDLTQPRFGAVSVDTRGTSSTSDDRIQYVPFTTDPTNPGFTDQFTYTIADSRGFLSTASVTLQVGNTSAGDQVRLTLRAYPINSVPDPSNPTKDVISSIQVGQEFQLRGYVQDLRPVQTGQDRGVFAAFQDIIYDRTLVGVKTSTNSLGFDVAFSGDYPNGQSGDIIIPGLINEVGSFSTQAKLDTTERLQFVIKMRANVQGIARFATDPADVTPFHDTLVYGDRNAVPIDKIAYVPATLTIGGSSGGGEGYTNPNNRFDVNNDSFVSPIDVLLLINLLNQGQGGSLPGKGNGGSPEGEAGENYYVDVDSDGYFTPLDALLIINELNGKLIGGEGEGTAAPPVEIVSNNVPATGNLVAETNAVDSLVSEIGPQIASASRTSSPSSLDSYLASLVANAEEEEEGIDEFLGDVLRVRLQS